MDWWIDILTTYTHHSELQEITVLPLIPMSYKSPQQLQSLFPAFCVFISCSLAAASNSGDSSASVLTALLARDWLTTDNYQLTDSPHLSFKITPHRGPHRPPLPISIVIVQLLQLPSNGLHNIISNGISVVVEACLLSCFIATAVVSLFVSRSLPINKSYATIFTNNLYVLK
jgi:hypothetical protein